ncbi:ISL3 family transposase [Acidihalobacter aeolianus]|uniref:ISL3 family transposase n=1 Tax=Acidihalobacter aeolianus TaxID=2792603 RepID=UPI000A3E0B1B|nr:ISL3 family transposase [Acidihalobacter aeolianus]
MLELPPSVADILNLPQLRAREIEENGDHYRIKAEGMVEPTACPLCASSLYRHGTQPQTYMDTPIHGKRVALDIQRRRFRCKNCGKTLFEPLPDIDDKRLATTRLVKYVETHCLRKTFAELSREVGIDDKTVRHIFDDYVARLKQDVVFETPEVLGIDELKIIGQYRAMITNVEKRALFDMLPTRNKADLIIYFKALPEKRRVKVLTMDLWSVYRQVAQDQFPGRMIVADRFHVVRMANDAIERVRKQIRKELSTRERLKLKNDRFILLSRHDNLSSSAQEKLSYWSMLHPHLGMAYAAKEAFHDIYNHPTKSDAMRAAKDWEASLNPNVAWAFREVKGALHSWWTEIFNYYDHPISNGYTESINNIAKGMNRMGRGYSFDVIRARLLFDDEARADTRTTVRKKVRKRVQPPDTFGYTMSDAMYQAPSQSRYKTVIEERRVEYGPYLPTLAHKLEAGDFD